MNDPTDIKRKLDELNDSLNTSYGTKTEIERGRIVKEISVLNTKLMLSGRYDENGNPIKT